ncbi:33038_t:CDS:2, partial [Racocetra persica]
NIFYDGNLKRISATLYQKYGDICEFRLGGYRRILLSRTDYFEDLLNPSTKNAMLFAKHEYTYAWDDLGTFQRGVFFNNNYETWKINRYLFSQSISTPGFNNEFIKHINKSFEELDGYWNSLRKSRLSGNDQLEMDFLLWINRFTSDIISVLVTGEQAYSMASYYNTFDSIEDSLFDKSKLQHSDKFINAIITHIRGTIFFVHVYPFLRRYVPLIKDKANSLLENRDFIFKTLDDIIEKRKIELAKTPQELLSRHDILTFLLSVNNDAKDKIADEEIRSILLDVFLDLVFPSDTSYVTADIIAKLKYCEAIIKETARIMPITSVSKRVAVAECEVAGYTWPARTMFHLNYASIHMNEKYWANPNVYNPDRFYLKNNLDEFENDLRTFDNEDQKFSHNMNRYSLVIFGGGVRICPGRRLAMINMLSFMALMFKKYDVELANMQAPLNTYTKFITTCLGLKIKIKPRKPL